MVNICNKTGKNSSTCERKRLALELLPSKIHPKWELFSRAVLKSRMKSLRRFLLGMLKLLEAEKGKINGRLKLWTAEGLGGASRINAMVMTRGPPGDYNASDQELGLDDWSWDRVEPFSRKSENNIARPRSKARGLDGEFLIGFHRTRRSNMGFNQD